MPVFVDGQHPGPGKAAEVKAVLFRCQLELAAKGRQAHIAIGDGGLVLQDNVYLPLTGSDGGPGGLGKTVDDGGDGLCLRVQPDGENDAGGVGIELIPFQGRRIAAKHLGGYSCRKEKGSEKEKKKVFSHETN